jgi:uncharacterized protein YndB with AHSA1/START domain
MRAHTVHVTYDFAKPPERVFAYLSEHENLGPLFGAQVKRLRDGDTDRNGVNSARELKVGPLPPFVETVHEVEPDRRIVYRITKGSPLKNHVGVMEFSPLPSGGTHFDYKIRIASSIPGVAPIVKTQLQRDIAKSLPRVDEEA